MNILKNRYFKDKIVSARAHLAVQDCEKILIKINENLYNKFCKEIINLENKIKNDYNVLCPVTQNTIKNIFFNLLKKYYENN